MSIYCFKFQSCRLVRVEGRKWLHYACRCILIEYQQFLRRRRQEEEDESYVVLLILLILVLPFPSSLTLCYFPTSNKEWPTACYCIYYTRLQFQSTCNQWKIELQEEEEWLIYSVFLYWHLQYYLLKYIFIKEKREEIIGRLKSALSMSA